MKDGEVVEDPEDDVETVEDDVETGTMTCCGCNQMEEQQTEQFVADVDLPDDLNEAEEGKGNDPNEVAEMSIT